MSPRIPFTPSQSSVNRVRIVDLPGLTLDEEVRGRTVSELISLSAIIGYAREEAAALKLPLAYTRESQETRVELPYFLARALNGPDPDARTAALKIVRRLGRNLGHLLLTLHRGDEINRAARADWNAGDWERWEKIRRVWLAGGLTHDPLGAVLIESARAFLEEQGYAGRIELERTPYRHHTVMLGAARYLPDKVTTAVSLDCGHTQIKRACLTLAEGSITRLQPFAPMPVRWNLRDLPWDHHDAPLGQEVCTLVTEALTRTLEESKTLGFQPGPEMVLALAAYIQGGTLLGKGLYVHLNALDSDARRLLARSLQARTGGRFHIRLIHDGTAAAGIHAGDPHSAVIVIGTALGIGFPPASAQGLRPLALTE